MTFQFTTIPIADIFKEITFKSRKNLLRLEKIENVIKNDACAIFALKLTLS